jgi:hypothetical protein
MIGAGVGEGRWQVSRRIRSVVVVFVALMILTSGLGALPEEPTAFASNRNKTVEVTPQYKRIIEPSDPSNPPTTPPAILPTVTCVRRVEGQKEVVFGYVHRGIRYYNAPVNDPFVTNYFMVGRDIVSDLGQLDQFLPGDHPSRFAVRTTRPAKWILDVPPLGFDEAGVIHPRVYWRVSIKARRSDCGAEVPSHFAVMRGGLSGSEIGRTVDIERLHIQPNRITAYSLEFAQQFFRVRDLICSAGGTRLFPRSVYLYGQGTFSGRSFDNLVPLPGAQVLGTSVLNGIVFTRTDVSKREVADVSVTTNVKVLVDAYARCQFGTTVVESADPHWGGDDGTQRIWSSWSLRPPAFEDFSYAAGSPGGGVRFR